MKSMKAETQSLKRCYKCKREQSRAEFNLDRTKKDGFNSLCKECASVKSKIRYQNNRAKMIAKAREWNQNNRERYNRTWTRYAKAHPEKIAQKKQRRQDRLARAPGGPFVASRYEARVEVYGGQCSYCAVSEATTLDHAIPVSRGGGNYPANIRPCCKICNLVKGAKKLYSEWVPPCVILPAVLCAKSLLSGRPLRSSDLSGA